MPYVSESSSGPIRAVSVERGGSQYPVSLRSSFDIPAWCTKSQYGWRTGSRIHESGLGIEGHYRNQAHRLAVLHELESQYLRGRPFTVYDRDYREELRQVGICSSSATLTEPYSLRKYSLTSQGGMAITQATGNPAPPSSSYLASEAGGMLRRSAPSQEEIDLARSLAELKDLPLLRRAMALPSSLAGSGHAYLALVFGFMPTAKDLLKTCETVVKSSDIVQSYLHNLQVSTRRNRERELYRKAEAYSRPLYLSPMGQWPSGDSNYFPGLTVRMGSVVPAFTYGSSLDIHTPTLSWSYIGVQILKTFATFEYYVPDPKNIRSRLDTFKGRAERLIGQGPSVAAVYDLTPWTWLVDWFVDIGGLLRYQQHIANNQIVMSRCGWSLWDEYTATITCTGWTHDNSRAGPSPTVCHGSCKGPECTTSFHRIIHTRRRGSPYSLSPTWDFSPQQWAILAALGLAKSAGVPYAPRS